MTMEKRKKLWCFFYFCYNNVIIHSLSICIYMTVCKSGRGFYIYNNNYLINNEHDVYNVIKIYNWLSYISMKKKQRIVPYCAIYKYSCIIFKKKIAPNYVSYD